LFLGLLSVACGGSQAVRPAPAPVTVTNARTKAADPPAPTAETCDGIRECASVGLLLARARERPQAQIALGKACTGTVRSIDACAVLAAMLEEDGADPAKLADVAHNGCNVYGAEDGERAARGTACAKWGAMLRDGRGTDVDPDRALRAFEDGCKLGSDTACAFAKDLETDQQKRTVATSGGNGVADANFTIGRLTANGVVVEDVSCHAAEGAAALAIGKPFADKKKALDACTKGKPHKARVRWTSASGRMSDVKVVSGDDPSNRCIEKALKGAKSTVAGTCVASVDLGH
jgi:TPR repeat protein